MLRCSTIAMFSLLLLACSTTVEQRDAALEAGAASCVGHCGEQAPSGCFCDEDCHENGDCCADAEAACSIEAAEECGPGEEEGDGDDEGGAATVCFMGPNRTNDVCLPLSFPGTPSGYSYPAPLNSNYRAPIAYLDLNAIDGNTMIAPNFKLSEFAQVHKGRWAVVQPHAVKRMQTIRDQAGAMSLNSGYRSPSYNASVDGASKSRHMYGDGFDFKASALSVNSLEPKCTSNGGFLVEYTSHVHCDWRNDSQDAKFFGSAALLPGAPDDFTFELPFEARIVEVDGVLTAPVEGFDEGEPVRRWTAWSASGEALAEHTGPEFVAPEDAVSVTVDVGRVVEAELTLE
jgi:hypothetical protein